MSNVTVLITACGNVYMPGTTKAIRENGERKLTLIGTDMNKDDTILEMVDRYYQVPRANDSSYVDVLYDICKKEHVDVVIPIMSAELEVLSLNKKKFEEIGTIISISDYEQLCIANDKLKLFNYMKNNNISCAKYYEVNNVEDVDKAIEEIGYPIVFKFF